MFWYQCRQCRGTLKKIKHFQARTNKHEKIATFLAIIKIKNNSSQIYKTWSFNGLKEKSELSLIIIDIQRIWLRQQKLPNYIPRKIKDEHAKYILSEVDKNGSLSSWTLIKSKSNIDVGRTRIVEIQK